MGRCAAFLAVAAFLGVADAAAESTGVRHEPMRVDVASGAAFGSIAYSRTTGAYGYSYGRNSRAEAEQVALGYCAGRRGRAADCAVLVWFRNACAALAKASNGAFGGDHAGDRRAAQQAALGICATYGGGDCRVVQTVCSR